MSQLTREQQADIVNEKRNWIKENALPGTTEDWEVDAMTDEELNWTINQQRPGGITQFETDYISGKLS